MRRQRAPSVYRIARELVIRIHSYSAHRMCFGADIICCTLPLALRGDAAVRTPTSPSAPFRPGTQISSVDFSTFVPVQGRHENTRSHHAVSPISQARIGDSNANYQAFMGFETRECDAHICLNLGFTSQSFRLTQVSPHVCYFWLSFFRMDEGNCLPSEHGLCRKGSSLQIKPLQRTFRPFQSLPQTLQPSEFVSQG